MMESNSVEREEITGLPEEQKILPMDTADSFVLREGERLDDLQREGLRIIQHPGRFCFGMDAVLLSAFARAGRGEKVLDLCTGTGVIPLLMSARYPKTRYAALEIQPESADMARRSVVGNGLEDRIQILEGDLCQILHPQNGGLTMTENISQRPLKETYGRWDVVTVNPPYMKIPAGAANRSQAFSVARHEVACSLEEVIEAASKLLRSKGRFYMVHRPLRLPEILRVMHEKRLEPKRIRFVHPGPGKESNIVLIEGMRDASEEMRVLPPLMIYDDNGEYTPQVREIYDPGSEKG